jgi:hypothetical protein
MKRIARAAVSVLSCLAFALPLWAQVTANVVGRWEMTNETPRGTMTSTFTFEQDGNTLSGTSEGQRGGEVQISTGSVDGDVITFTIVRGMGGRTMEMTYTGTVDGDTITGTMYTPRGERDFSMKRVEG